MVGRAVTVQTDKGPRPKIILEMDPYEAQTAQEVLSHVEDDYRGDVLADALCDGVTDAQMQFPELWEVARYVG